MITHWARDRTQGSGPIPLAQAVKLQTLDTARLVGLTDRGVLATGKRADINIIDLKQLKLRKPEIVQDLPTEATRWMQRADGYKRTIVAGRTTFIDGAATGELPGKLVRNPLRHMLRGKVTHVEAATDSKSIIDVSTIAPPRSTNDTLIGDADLDGGASAVARAARKHIAVAERVSSTGDFLSGRVLNMVGLDSQGRPLHSGAASKL